MFDVKNVARLLSVSEKTVYRWIRKNEIPAYRMGDSYRFNRIELLQWATERKIRVSREIFAETTDQGETMPSVSEALGFGGIHYRVPGHDKESVIRSIVAIMHLPEDVDKDFLAEALIARENLGTTAIGGGIAIPHVRNPIIFHVSKPILSLCFLEEPIDFCALDKKKVDTVFTIITHTIKSHLHILSRLSYALQNDAIRLKISSQAPRQQILDALSAMEQTLGTTGTQTDQN